ncbi:MAG: ATP-binding protein [Ktedonobacteraceae bacterium]
MKWRPYTFGIRVQLTVWYTLVSAILIFIFGVTLYTALQTMLISSFDTTLQMRAQQVAEGVSINHNAVSISDIVSELPELNATAALLDPADVHRGNAQDVRQRVEEGSNVYSNRNIVVRVFDTHGKMIYCLPTSRNIAIPTASISQPLQGKPWHGTITNPNGQQTRLYGTMLVDHKTIFGVVQVGQSFASVNIHMQHIMFLLLLCTPLALLFSAYGSYLLAGRAFRPIHRLTHTVHEIGAKDLHQRVPIPAAKDEVRELALIFNQMIGRLEHAFNQQRRFVADASHELRTPVSVIRSITDVALSQPSTPEEYVQVLKDINAESERLGKLINDLLALARADEALVQFDHDAVQLDLLTSDVVDSMEALAIERGITLSVGELQPATILGDAARLIQVIMSLVDNALTYTNAGGVVTLSVKTTLTHALLVVRDTGIGIASKDQKHIFERFYRADPTRSRAAGGSGLGLSIVEWVVRVHDGDVSVESQPGQGSTFTVALPLLQDT